MSFSRGLSFPRGIFPALVLGLTMIAAAQPQTSGSSSAPQEPTSETQPVVRDARNKEDLEFFVRHLYVWGPQIKVEIGDLKPSPLDGLLETEVRASYQFASQVKKFYVSKDGAYVTEAHLFEMAKNPFHEANEKITTEGQPAFGEAGAPVVIVAYSDFQCPYCAEEAKLLRTQLAQEYSGRVRVYFHDFPLPTHNWAKQAAIAGRCIYNADPELFWTFHDWIFENQSAVTSANLTESVASFVTKNDGDSLAIAGCIESEATAPEVEKSVAEGQSLGVTSTPTIFVNGRKLTGSLKWDQLKQIIDYEIDYQKVAQNAGDDCGCQISLSPLGVE